MISLHSNDVRSKCAIRERLERDMAEYLAKGGKAREVTGYSPQKPYMSVRDQNRASWLRTQAGKGEE